MADRLEPGEAINALNAISQQNNLGLSFQQAGPYLEARISKNADANLLGSLGQGGPSFHQMLSNKFALSDVAAPPSAGVKALGLITGHLHLGAGIGGRTEGPNGGASAGIGAGVNVSSGEIIGATTTPGVDHVLKAYAPTFNTDDVEKFRQAAPVLKLVEDGHFQEAKAAAGSLPPTSQNVEPTKANDPAKAAVASLNLPSLQNADSAHHGLATGIASGPKQIGG